MSDATGDVGPMKRPWSIRQQLGLLITVPIVLLVAIYTIAVSRDARRREIAEAGERLERVSPVYAETYASAAVAMRQRLFILAQDSALQRYLRRPTTAARTAATSVLTRVAADANTTAELWNGLGERVLSLADSQPPFTETFRYDVMERARLSGTPVISPIVAEAGGYGYASVAMLGDSARPTGFLVARGRLRLSPQDLQDIKDLVGPTTTLLIGNRNDDVWTNFLDSAPPPPREVRDRQGIVEYTRAGRGPVVARIVPVSNTPWTIIVEFPRSSVLHPAGEQFQFLVLVGVTVLLVAVAGAWLVSGAMTRPLARLARAAEAISVGDYSARVEADRHDELGAVATAFNRMGESLVAARNDLQRRAAALTASEARYRVVFDASPHPTWVFDTATRRFLAVNDAAIAAYGYSRDEFLAMSVIDLHPRDEAARVLRDLVERDPGTDVHAEIWRHVRRNGEVFDVEISAQSLVYDGAIARLVVAVDVSARLRAERVLHATQARLEHLLGSSGAVIFNLVLGRGEARLAYISENLTQILGYAVADAHAPNWWATNVHPDDRRQLRGRPHPEAYRDGAMEYRFRHRDGGYRWLREEQRVIRDEAGTALEVVGVWLDVTERRLADDTLRTTQERLRHIVSSSGSVLYNIRMTAAMDHPIWIGENVARVLGHELDDTTTTTWLREHIHPDDLATLTSRKGALRFEEGEREYRFRHGDGTWRWLRDSQHLLRNAEGKLVEVVGTWVDVTEQRRLEEQLLQSQKMEAVGRLAGGVAHDFNNLLTVILAECESVQRVEGQAPPSTIASVEEIRKSAERAALLTRQLLTFSRQQMIELDTVSVNDIVTDMEKMLRRIIGEDIALSVRLHKGPTHVSADRGQLDQVILNLAINARDAMTDGGSLTIETSTMRITADSENTHDLETGDYVVMSVSDTGTGMSDEVKAHLFEPFFTTKERGKGTGLGLATSYGIVQQFEGQISVYSEPGLGTTMRVYLPRVVMDTPQRAAIAIKEAHARMPSGTETILLVEDEPPVRRVVVRMLENCGYRVYQAGDGEEAVRFLENNTNQIDLLLTDVVLPRMGGRALAERAAQLRPGIRVLFSSGYSDDVMLQHRLIEGEVAMLQKPYSADVLARKVREVLDTPVHA
jgi:PAS domain S-box-containing protein